MSEEFHLESNPVKEDRGVQRKTSESAPKRTSPKPKERPEEGPDLFDIAEKTTLSTPIETGSKDIEDEETETYEERRRNDNVY